MKIYEAMDLLHDDISNWMRWLCDKTIAPARHVSMLGKMAILKDRESRPVEKPKTEINTLDAEKFEDIVNSLSERERLAFRLHVVGVAFVRGKVQRPRNKWHAARLMRISDRHYRRIVCDALNNVATKLGYNVQ